MGTSFDSVLQVVGDNPYLQAAVVVVAFGLLAWLTDAFISRALAIWARRSKTDLDDRFIALVHKPVFLSIVFLGLWLASSRLDLPEVLSRFLLRFLKSLALLIWVVFFLRLSSLLVEVLRRYEERSRLIDPRTLSLADNVAKIVVVGGGIYFLFLSWDIDVGALLVTGGVMGVAIGFAAKDTLANLFGGIFILADAPYQVGDFVVLGSGERGQVTQVGLRSTRLLTRDDVEITVPNAVIANAKIINESGGPWVKERVRVKVGVAYGSDIDQVREILLAVAADNPDVEDDPEPRVRFRAFGDSSLDLELLGWVREPVLRGRVLDALYSEVYKRFNAADIEIPFPKRDVYLHRNDDA